MIWIWIYWLLNGFLSNYDTLSNNYWGTWTALLLGIYGQSIDKNIE